VSDHPEARRQGTLWQAFGHAGRGLRTLWRAERNIRIDLALGATAIGLGGLLRISAAEWLALTLAIGMVLAVEAVNTALELLADAVHPAQHPMIGQAKDVAAAAALIAALTAVVVGGIIFIPALARSTLGKLGPQQDRGAPQEPGDPPNRGASQEPSRLQESSRTQDAGGPEKRGNGEPGVAMDDRHSGARAAGCNTSRDVDAFAEPRVANVGFLNSSHDSDRMRERSPTACEGSPTPSIAGSDRRRRCA